MLDLPDNQRLAAQFIDKTLALRPGENIWLEYQGANAESLALACRDKANALGAAVYFVDSGSQRTHMLVPDIAEQHTALAAGNLAIMQQMDAYIRICDDDDQLKLAADAEQKKLLARAVKDATEYRISNLRWLVISAPTLAFAKACGQTPEEFRQFYLDANLFDYEKMDDAVAPLAALMTASKDVHIKGKDTDIQFSIEGIPAISCTGKHNIPDGECFTAPVKDSVNGTILFGPSVYQGAKFSSIWLRFENGKAVDAKAGTDHETAELNRILDMDEGARYVGEFAIAFHPRILSPVGDILFDEKISGSLHMALGRCYANASNGNESLNHWDMVHIQRPEYGGGEIWMDSCLIRKDGLFIVPELKGLNPGELMPAP